MDLTPIVKLFFLKGIHTGVFHSGFIMADARNPPTIPHVRAPARFGGEYRNYLFQCRKNDVAIFREDNFRENLDYERMASDAIWRAHGDQKHRTLMIDEWLECLTSYYEWICITESEMANKSQEAVYRVYTDNNTLRDELYYLKTRSAAEYFSQQHRIWQEHIWDRKNIYAYMGSGPSYEIVQREDHGSVYTLWVRVTPPRWKRREPFLIRRRWHVAKLVPEITTREKKVEKAGHLDKDTYIPGDPRILRETGSGQFGSYPSFEGDNEEE